MTNRNFRSGKGLRSILIVLAFLLLTTACIAQSLSNESRYLGQALPGNIPKAFPLSVNQGFFAAERIAISPDGRDIYYSEIKSYYPIKGENIKRYSFSEGKWQGPFNLFDGYAPAFSVTGDTLYFERKDVGNNSEVYLTVRNGQGWSQPKRILASLEKAHYFQVTRNKNYYISSNSGKGLGLNDWCRIMINGSDTTVVSLGTPLNTGFENLDFYVAGDDSYMIISSPVGLAISFAKEGKWTNPVNLGKKINFGLGMWGPWVTSDNKFLFYSTGTKPDYSNVSVYWVRVDGLIDSIKRSQLQEKGKME